MKSQILLVSKPYLRRAKPRVQASIVIIKFGDRIKVVHYTCMKGEESLYCCQQCQHEITDKVADFITSILQVLANWYPFCNFSYKNPQNYIACIFFVRLSSQFYLDRNLCKKILNLYIDTYTCLNNITSAAPFVLFYFNCKDRVSV